MTKSDFTKSIVRVVNNDNSSGTGFFIKNSYILTAYHVIGSNENNNISITLKDNTSEKIPARLIDYNEICDVALLEVSIKTSKLTYLKSANRKIIEGDLWSTFGYPETRNVEGAHFEGKVNLVTDNIQDITYHFGLDCNQFPEAPAGLSGSPVIIDGNAVGIITKAFTGSDNFFGATSITLIKEILEKYQIKLTKEYPKIKINELEINKQWFDSISNRAIANLGPRYSSELNFKDKELNIFEALGRTDDFKKLLKNRLDQLIIVGRKISISQVKIDISANKIELEEKYNLLIKLILNHDDHCILVNEIILQIESINEILNQILEKIKKHNRKIKDESDPKFINNYDVNKIIKFKEKLRAFHLYFETNTEIALYNQPALLIVGDAGMGKSHLMGSAISERMDKDLASIFLLGHYFIGKESPWNQILTYLEVHHTTSTMFLNAINEYGEQRQKRIVFAIDAINEGDGLSFWPGHILGFINEIKQLKWIALIISIRSTYNDVIFGDNARNLNIYKHIGFTNHVQEVTRLFFKYYRIQSPKMPILNPEFHNPLFLKLLCQGLKNSNKTSIPDGLQGITSIFYNFIESINKILSRSNQLYFYSTFNPVQLSIDEFVTSKYKNKKKINRLTISEVHILIQDMLSKKKIEVNYFIEHLISEGIFMKEYNKPLNAEVVNLAYERLENHYHAA